MFGGCSKLYNVGWSNERMEIVEGKISAELAAVFALRWKRAELRMLFEREVTGILRKMAGQTLVTLS